MLLQQENSARLVLLEIQNQESMNILAGSVLLAKELRAKEMKWSSA